MTEAARRATILLLLEVPGDRRVLTSALSADYDVVAADRSTTPFAEGFDLCILDTTALSRFWPEISQRKARDEPVFLPFLLLSPPELIDMALDVPVHAFDEVIAVPTRMDRLIRRVSILMQLRKRTVELQRAGEAYERLARLYDSQRNIADTLQSAILVLPDAMPGVRFGHLYHSASEAARVGGDFYDLFEVPGGLGILLGDVAGHGLEAAALAALTKNVVKAYALEHDSSAEVVSRTNTVIESATSSSVFVTLFLGLLRLGDGRLNYCTAGQSTPLVVRRDGSERPLLTGQPLVGAFTDVEFTDSETVLEPGETLALYTDGVIEARRDHEMYGQQRLSEVLSRSATDDVETIPRSIFQSVLDFTGGVLQDDVAILALSRLAE